MVLIIIRSYFSYSSYIFNKVLKHHEVRLNEWWSNWSYWCYVKAYFSDFVPTRKCNVCWPSLVTSFLCLWLHLLRFFVADEGFSKRPAQHLVFHPLCEEKSLSYTWSERTDDNNNNNNNRCVLLVWRITEAQWVYHQSMKQSDKYIDF